MRHGASHCYGPLVQLARAASQVVVGIKINIHGNTRGRASLANLELLQLHRALRAGLALLRGDGAVQVHRSSQTRAGVDEARSAEVHFLNGNPDREGTDRSIFTVDRPRLAFDLQRSAAW